MKEAKLHFVGIHGLKNHVLQTQDNTSTSKNIFPYSSHTYNQNLCELCVNQTYIEM